MFIVSVKPKKKTVIIVSAIVAAVILLIIGITVLSTAPASANGEKGSYSLEADGNAGRIEFLEQFGWKTSGKATKTEKITIPSEFNEVYTLRNIVARNVLNIHIKFLITIVIAKSLQISLCLIRRLSAVILAKQKKMALCRPSTKTNNNRNTVTATFL